MASRPDRKRARREAEEMVREHGESAAFLAHAKATFSPSLFDRTVAREVPGALARWRGGERGKRDRFSPNAGCQLWHSTRYDAEAVRLSLYGHAKAGSDLAAGIAGGIVGIDPAIGSDRSVVAYALVHPRGQDDDRVLLASAVLRPDPRNPRDR
jgi:hypothetical protein